MKKFLLALALATLLIAAGMALFFWKSEKPSQLHPALAAAQASPSAAPAAAAMPAPFAPPIAAASPNPLPVSPAASPGAPLLSSDNANIGIATQWPGARVLEHTEPGAHSAAGDPGSATGVTVIQPSDVPYPVRIEEPLPPGKSAAAGGHSLPREVVANRLIVRLAPGTTAEDLQRVKRAAGAVSVKKISDLGQYQLTLPTATADAVPQAMARLKNAGLPLLYVESDPIIHAQLAPNDPYYTNGTLWGMNNTGQNAGVADADIDAPEGWDTRTNASSVIVAVVDTGIRYTHEDLAANMWTNPGEVAGDGIDNDGDGFVDDVYGINAITGSGNPMDDNGHGSHCAGTIGGVGNNGVGVIGVAWNVKLMACKFLSSSGAGATSDAIACIDFARQKGAKIISASWGSAEYAQSLTDTIAATRDADIIFVAAAGNSNLNIDNSPFYPASLELENMVTVAASTRTDVRASFSNFGYGHVEVAAAGLDITSCGAASDNEYKTLSGTSMATPQVAGVLAMARAQFPGASARQIINRLYRSVKPVADFSGKTTTGGRVNLQRTLLSTTDRPVNDDFSAAAVLPVGTNLSTWTSNVGATAEAGEPAHGGVTAATTLWWSYTPTTNGSLVFSTVGSVYDTTLAVYTGSAMNALTLVAQNDDASAQTTASRVQFSVTAGTTYRIAVGGKNGASGFTKLNVSLPPANDDFANATLVSGLPVIATGSLVNATKEPGEPAHAGNAGGASVWWKWVAPSSGSVSIGTSGSPVDTLLAVYTGTAVNALAVVAQSDDRWDRSSSLVTFNAVSGQTYYIAVDGKDGATGSIKLTISAPPANDNFASATPLSGLFLTANGTLNNATREVGEPQHAGVTGGSSIWYRWTAPATQSIQLHTANSPAWTYAGGTVSAADTILAVYTGSSVGALTEIASNDDFTLGRLDSFLTFTAIAGTTYYFAVDGYAGATGDIVLVLQEQPPAMTNDLFSERTPLYGTTGRVSSNNVRATPEAGEPLHDPAGYSESNWTSVWWKWVAPANGSVTFNTIGSNFDTVLAVYTGTAVNALTAVAKNNNITDANGNATSSQSSVTFNAVRGTEYQIAVASWFGSGPGNVILNFNQTLANQLPVVTAATITPGDPAYSDTQLGVTGIVASDPENNAITYGYQWQTSPDSVVWTDVAGATGATVAANDANAGKFWRCAVRASDATGDGVQFFTAPRLVNRRPAATVAQGAAYSYISALLVPSTRPAITRSVIINEISKGPSGNKEWIELLVLKTTDLRGWELDRASGGHIRFRSDNTFWQSIAAGTLIVIYNNNDRDPALPADNLDPSQWRLIIPANNSTLFDNGSGNPGQFAPQWNLMNNQVNQEMLVMRPTPTAGVYSGVDSVSWGTSTGLPYGNPTFTTFTSNQALRYDGGTETGAELLNAWNKVTAGASDVTPGQPNGGENTAFIESLREQPARFRFGDFSQKVSGLSVDPVTGVLSGTANVPGGGDSNIILERYNSTTTVSQSFTLSVTTPISAWRQAYFGSILNSGSAADTADGDRDGIPNLLEYALGGNPNAADRSILPTGSVSANHLRLAFSCDAAKTDISYIVQASNDLVSWSDIARSTGGGATSAINSSGATISDSGSGVRAVTVTDAAVVSSASKRFLRLKVSRP